MYRFENSLAAVEQASSGKERRISAVNRMTGNRLTAVRVRKNTWQISGVPLQEIRASSDFTVIEYLLRELGLPTMTVLRHLKKTEDNIRKEGK